MKTSVILSMLVGMSLMFFQNCGKVSFTSANGMRSDSKLIPLDITDTHGGGSGGTTSTTGTTDDDDNSSTTTTDTTTDTTTTTDNGSDGSTGIGTTTPTDPTVVTEIEDHDDHGKKDDDDGDDDDNDHHSRHPEDEGGGSQDTGTLVACNLDAQPKSHGNSLKLGLIDNQLSTNNTSCNAQVVCISENACLNKVSVKFGATSVFPGSKGVCGGNKKVVVLTDAQIDDLLK